MRRHSAEAVPAGRAAVAGALGVRCFVVLSKLTLERLGLYGRTSRLIRLRVDLQRIFRRRTQVGAHLQKTPLLLPPRLEVAFVKTWRTLSYAYDSVGPSATTRAANRGKGQRWRPSVAALQASALKRASAFTSSLGCVPGYGRSSSAPALFDEAVAEACDRGTFHSESGSDGAVLPALGRFEGHTSPGHFADRRRPVSDCVNV
jgi:hypothetical protein